MKTTAMTSALPSLCIAHYTLNRHLLYISSFLPPFELGEEAAHHLPVFPGCDGTRQVLVHFVEELDAVVNHLLHGTLVEEVAAVIAMAAVVEL